MPEVAYTVKQAANELQVSTRTVRRWLRNGKLHGHLVGRDDGLKEWRIDAVSLMTVRGGRQSRPKSGGKSLDALSDEIRLLREQNAEYLQAIGQLAGRVAALERTLQRLLPPASSPAGPRAPIPWWRRLFRGGTQNEQ